MKKRFLFFLPLLLLFACDSRELLIPIELPNEGPKLFIQAFIGHGDIPRIRLERVRPIDGTYALSNDVTNANIRLFEDGQLKLTFIFKSDTVVNYSVISRPTGIDTISRRESITNYYTTLDGISLKIGSYYHITVDAPGFPSLISEPVLFLDEFEIISAQASESVYLAEGYYQLPNVSFVLRKNGQVAKNLCWFTFLPWYDEVSLRNYLFSDRFNRDRFPISIEQEIPAIDITEINISDRDIGIFELVPNFNSIDSFYHIPHEGTWAIVQTYNEAAIKYFDALENDSEYIGGFFPPNPLFPHTVEGGYGIFSIFETDTVRLN